MPREPIPSLNYKRTQEFSRDDCQTETVDL